VAIKRTIGPVTTAATLGSITGVLLLGVLTRLGLDLTDLEVAAVVGLPTAIGGYLVRPQGRRGEYVGS
jgi:hypothetical protein